MRLTTHNRIAAAALMVLFLNFFAARGMFYHTHFVGSSFISHSHPYSDSAHSHTTAQIISIEYVAATSVTDICAVGCDNSPLIGFSLLDITPVIPSTACGFSGNICWRAPPSC